VSVVESGELLAAASGRDQAQRPDQVGRWMCALP